VYAAGRRTLYVLLYVTSVKMTPPPLCRKAEGRDELFVSTRWTVVLQAGESATSAQAFSALSELCRIYWRPVYVFLRKKGYGREDAQDLTQGFFADLIATRGYAHADRAKGRFRAFLLTALKKFIADARDRQRALKRGGRVILEKLDEKTEAQIVPAAKWQADEVYDREWAASLVRRALDRLAQACELAGKGELFGYFVPYFAAPEGSPIP
jgi:DNA-directed RNA polymerase specialized sigma24 family protein